METVLSLPWNADDGEGRKEYHTLLFVIMDSFFSLNSVYVFSFNSPPPKKETHLYVWLIYDRISKYTPVRSGRKVISVSACQCLVASSTIQVQKIEVGTLWICNYSGTKTSVTVSSDFAQILVLLTRAILDSKAWGNISNHLFSLRLPVVSSPAGVSSNCLFFIYVLMSRPSILLTSSWFRPKACVQHI